MKSRLGGQKVTPQNIIYHDDESKKHGELVLNIQLMIRLIPGWQYLSVKQFIK